MNSNNAAKTQLGDDESTSRTISNRPRQLIRVLVVDDNDLVLAAVTHRLIRMGYSVVGVSDVEEAMAQLKSGASFDYLLADIMLEGSVTGTMLARHVRSCWPATKVVLMTGYQDFELPKNSYPEDLPILQKPFEAADLRRVFNPPAAVAA